MQQKNQMANFSEVPIDKGTLPNWETRLGYPKLYNMFIGEMNKAYCTPWLEKININFELENARAVLRTTFDNGAYIVVTQNNVLRIKFTGEVEIVSAIPNTGLDVQMSENLQNQVGIVDGRNFWVYSQRVSDFIKMGEAQGFVYNQPISITVLNSIAIVLDLETNGWAISDPNQMTNFPVLDNVAQISSSLTQASTLETLDDNLYIFGTTGIERWVPTSTNNLYLFPFAKDNNFRVDFGSISTNGAERGFGKIYFLSSKFVPMVITGRGTESQDIGAEGMARIIEKYPDVGRVQTSFYSFDDNFFFHMYFPESKISWVYSEKSGKWANGDDHITGAVERTNVVITDSGLFNLTDDKAFSVSKLREWQSERIKNYKGTEPNRSLINAVELQMIQGILQSSLDEPQQVRLKISLDSDSWLNTVPAPIGRTGDRNDLTIWRCNIAAKEYTLNMQYQGPYNFTIDKVTIVLK